MICTDFQTFQRTLYHRGVCVCAYTGQLDPGDRGEREGNGEGGGEGIERYTNCSHWVFEESKVGRSILGFLKNT